MDFQELKLSLSEMEARLQDIKDNILLIDNKKTRLNEIDSELSKEEVWSDLELSQKLSKEKTTLEKSIKSFDDVSRKLSDSVVLLEVSIEENDDSSIEDILNERNEIEIFKNHGIDNLKVLSLLSFSTMMCGVFILLIFYTFSSNLKNHYLNLKNKFSSENEYLAVVNENGLWIKEEIDGSSNIIHARKFNKNNIEDITITQTIAASDNINIITAKNADISSKTWSLNEVKIVDKLSGSNKYDNIKYSSSFDGEIISNLFSNLNSLNIYQLNLLFNNLKN